MDEKTLKWIGLFATAIGFGATLMSNWVGDKKQEVLIENKVNKAIEKHLKNK